VDLGASLDEVKDVKVNDYPRTGHEGPKREGRGIPLLILRHRRYMEWLVNTTPRPHNPRAGEPVTRVREAGWDPGSVIDVLK